MNINEMSGNLDIKLPENLDVLIYIHKTETYTAPFVAHALQYNVYADGETPEQALNELIKLVKIHCGHAIEKNFNPVNRSNQYLWDAWGLGVTIPDHAYAHVNVRLAQGFKEVAPEVRSICEIQKKCNKFDIEEFVRAIA